MTAQVTRKPATEIQLRCFANPLLSVPGDHWDRRYPRRTCPALNRHAHLTRVDRYAIIPPQLFKL